MPRAFDQINEHFFGAPRNSRRGVPNVVVVRSRISSDVGIPRSVSFRVDRNRPASLNFTTPKNHLAEEENFNIDTPSIHSQQISITENKDGEMEITIPEEGGFSMAFSEAHMDGIHHLADQDSRIRMMWRCLIILFVCLAAYQIGNQINLYFTTPIATNIEADYPTQINLPTVAICNNNQFRLTYLTGARVQNRKAKNITAEIKGLNDTSDNIFDQALMNTWDMDAVKFLRNAAHWKSRMILACTYPNGTRCRLTDFKAVWTLTGLCWAINTDPQNPVMISGAGPSHGMKLLLNIERYERVESCNPKFRTTSLPGLKILIYNQTDIPTSAMDGVNVPPGYTMDIPFRMQHRQKLPGYNCIQEENKSSGDKLDNSQDARTCKIRNYLIEIERQCACSMRRAYDPNPKEDFPFCNVMDYFECVVPVLRWGNNGGFNSFKCMANCDEIDYIAWQDMNELPDNIFPKLIDSEDEQDESDVDEDENLDDEMYVDELRSEHFRCEDNQILEDHQVNRIKREAHRAYEKQTRYQEDILLRTKRLMTRMFQAADKVRNLRWGWKNDNFSGIYERLVNNTSCFGNMSAQHSDVFNAINNKAARSEEKRAKMLVHLLNKGRFLKPESEFRTISDVKHVYGADVVDEQQILIEFVEEYIHQLMTIYDEDSYTETLTRHLERMDRILHLMDQYDSGKLQRKAWAEKMKARNFLHFFEEDFYEGWYNVITRDLDVIIGKNVADLEAKVDSLKNMTVNATGLQIGSVILFGDTAANHTKLFGDFIDDILSCTFGEIKNTSKDMSAEFKKVMHEFQSAYINLFKKELPEYLENFEFGPKFVKENFAHVNVFLHKMNIEHWKQSSTYSFWSFLCDVGGALGLFLGISLLTICDFIYIFFKRYVIDKWWFQNKWTTSEMEKVNRFTRNKWDLVRCASSRLTKSRSRRDHNSDSDDDQNEYELMVPVEDEIEAKGRRKIRFRPLRKFPGMIRRSFRKRFANNKIQKVEEDEEEDMDLTEIKPENEKIKDFENHSISMALSAPIDVSTRSTPSGISRETRSAPSIQNVVIDIEENPEVEVHQMRSKSPSRSPFISSVHESSNSSLPIAPIRFQSPSTPETEPPRDPFPRKESEQPEDPMFKSVSEENEEAKIDRSKSQSLPATATIDSRKSPHIHFPSPPATDPPNETSF